MGAGLATRTAEPSGHFPIREVGGRLNPFRGWRRCGWRSSDKCVGGGSDEAVKQGIVGNTQRPTEICLPGPASVDPDQVMRGPYQVRRLQLSASRIPSPE